MGKHLTYTDRLRIEEGKKHGLTIKAIAEEIGFSERTIYYELKRGVCKQKELYYDACGDKKYRYKEKYAPEVAERKYREHLLAKGAPLKIGSDYELAEYIENRIIKDGLSPLAVLGEMKARDINFKTSICVRTVYNYIDKGVFLRLNLRHLPLKGRRKRKHNRTIRISRPPRGESIEKRPTVINDRTEFGHWEMDCVVGNTLPTLLTFTERLTRKEIIIKLPNRKRESVVRALDTLERKHGRRFRKIFKSITVDNGVEFADCEGMERSIYGVGEKRTIFYYCHPYTSCERGTNERMNREVRRVFPKGTNFMKITPQQISAAEKWINNYPRQILNFLTAEEVYQSFVLKI